MENQDKTIKELLDSLNNSIEDIRNHPTKIDRIPSNFEILIRGVNDSKGLETLFSPQIDTLINSLFNQIESGNFEKVLSNKDTLQSILDVIFGEGAFQGRISNAVLSNIQRSVESQRFQTMQQHMGKTMAVLKKKNLIIKNLEKGKRAFKDNHEEYKKYKDAVYAIKNVIKFAERIYRSRKLINKKVYNGLNNIVHESFEVDEILG